MNGKRLRGWLKDERGAVYPYLIFWVIIVFCALVWIIFNEVVLHIGDWVSTGATESSGGTWPILITLCRATPMIIILGSFIWAVVQSHREGRAY